MPYDEGIEVRIKNIVASWKNTDDKKMFGGVCHLLNGKMFCGVYKNFLILRLGEKESEGALKLSHVRPFDITGRPMKGWVMVSPEGYAGAALEDWLDRARTFVSTLPPK